MSFTCKIGLHDWSVDCEKCSKCGKPSNKVHNWKNDCEKCSECGITKENQHNWISCRCASCGKTRDKKHNWIENCNKCSECGKSRENQHSWDGCKCLKCSTTRNQEHEWDNSRGICTKCGKRVLVTGTYNAGNPINTLKPLVDDRGWAVKETYICTVCHKLVAQRYTNFGHTPHGTPCKNCGSIICNHCIPAPNQGAILLSVGRAPLCPFCQKAFH